MGWSLGFDTNWKRYIGYGVPAYCDQPGCNKLIDRGLGCVCGANPYGGEDGCGLFFCGEHIFPFICERCFNGEEPFNPKPDHPTWIRHKLTHESWQEWREENKDEVIELLIEYNIFLRFIGAA